MTNELPSHPSRRGALKAVGLLVVLAALGSLAFVIWNRGDDYQGDLVAFCTRLLDSSGSDSTGDDSSRDDSAGDDSTGVDSTSQNDEVSYYGTLVAVAPRDIRSTVKRLQDATRDLQELREGEDLEAYFRAAFDPEQETAEDELENYANEECGLDDVCDSARPAIFC